MPKPLPRYPVRHTAAVRSPPLAAPTFDLQSHSTHSDGALAPGRRGRPRRRRRRRAARADRSRLGRRRRRGARRGAHARASASSPPPSSPRSTRRARTCTCSATASTITRPRSPRRWRRFRADRRARGHRMADALRENGWALDVPERESLGRPHLAAAAFAHPANQARIRAAGLADVLGPPRGRADPRRPVLPPAHAADRRRRDRARARGGRRRGVGAPVLGRRGARRGARRRSTASPRSGLDGVEAFYVTHTAEQTRLVAGRCAELGLLTTGSADFHGPDHPLFSRFRAFELHGIEPRLGPLAD